MIEIKGWINIQLTTDGEEGLEETKLAVNKIQVVLNSYSAFNQYFKIVSLNGCHTLYIGLNHNHENEYIDLIIQLLNDIVSIAKGSYGLIYLRLPEDPIHFNHFQILKLSKGKIEKIKDSLLSPCNPIIED